MKITNEIIKEDILITIVDKELSVYDVNEMLAESAYLFTREEQKSLYQKAMRIAILNDLRIVGANAVSAQKIYNSAVDSVISAYGELTYGLLTTAIIRNIDTVNSVVLSTMGY